MQNKPNLPEIQMNITSVTTRDYKVNQPAGHRQNKPNWPAPQNKRNLCFNKELQKFSSQPTHRKQKNSDSQI